MTNTATAGFDLVHEFSEVYEDMLRVNMMFKLEQLRCRPVITQVRRTALLNAIGRTLAVCSELLEDVKKMEVAEP